MAKWWLELLLAGIYIIGGVFMFVYAIKKDKPYLLIIYGSIFIAAGWFLSARGTKLAYPVYAIAILFMAIGIYKLIRRSTKMPRT